MTAFQDRFNSAKVGQWWQHRSTAKMVELTEVNCCFVWVREVPRNPRSCRDRRMARSTLATSYKLVA